METIGDKVLKMTEQDRLYVKNFLKQVRLCANLTPMVAKALGIMTEEEKKLRVLRLKEWRLKIIEEQLVSLTNEKAMLEKLT